MKIHHADHVQEILKLTERKHNPCTVFLCHELS